MISYSYDIQSHKWGLAHIIYIFISNDVPLQHRSNLVMQHLVCIQMQSIWCQCCNECSGGEIELEENRLGRGDVGHG